MSGTGLRPQLSDCTVNFAVIAKKHPNGEGIPVLGSNESDKAHSSDEGDEAHYFVQYIISSYV